MTCGRIPLHFISGKLYKVTFTDDFSRKTRIYYLNHKDEAFEMFKEFKALIENQKGKKIKIFRSDNGGENTSKEFIDFCEKEGIKKETIVPYTPEQNRVAERNNRSIIKFACVMLHDQNFPKFLWGEATNVDIYVQNRVPHKALDNKTLEEVFTGFKPDFGHLCIFGYPYTFMCQRKKGTTWKSQEEKVHFLDIVKILKHLEYIFLIKGRLELVGMLHLMKIPLLAKQGTFLCLLLLRRMMIWIFFMVLLCPNLRWILFTIP